MKAQSLPSILAVNFAKFTSLDNRGRCGKPDARAFL